ncbi:transposase [Luteolibacter sp. AS25]|uniref:transposase n=1 Tax=Luteolibacter sp. AS25 TaxID=3135776 RepID=UPI00398B1DF8
MRFFNDLAQTDATKNRLPHWQQEGATYFVTWRLKDSIPRKLLDEWKIEREEWRARNPQPWSIETETEFHKRFSTRIDTVMDKGHGECVLRKKKCREVLSHCFDQFAEERFLMHSWVAMPNHVHALFTIAEDRQLETVVGAWKGNSAKSINQLIGQTGSLWQKDYFDRIIRDWQHMFRVAKYIRRNPTKGKLKGTDYALYEADWVKRMLGNAGLD